MRCKRSIAALIVMLAVSCTVASDRTEWINVSRKVATDGIVLLKNEANALPLVANSRIAYFGAKEFLQCGGGSSKVESDYSVSVRDGLARLGVISVTNDADVGLVHITRRSSEGRDPPDEAYELAASELKAVADAADRCRKTVVILNVGHLINLKPLKDNPRVSAILLVWFPGMEGGNAIADVLSGRVNPSGRLADTIAERISDYPSHRYFRANPVVLSYAEGEDVGYRYFNRKAKDRIVYPFGHGLSYTTFSESEPVPAADGSVSVTVVNTGNVAGRHSVLFFRDGELQAYGKTDVLSPGASETLRLVPFDPERKTPVSRNEAEERAIDDILAKMSIEEKVNLCSAQPPAMPKGTAGVGNLPKYGLPNSQTADGPNGVRRSGSSVCHPVGALLAQTFDDNLAYEMGRAIGEEAASLKVDILLGPGLNIHRHPLCGRNFEYFSEDPLLSGKMAAAYVRGVQSTGTAATIKHFCCNNREWNRKDYSSTVDEKTLRNIYLRGFEIAIKEGHPRCVMTSYNLLNGIHTAENAWLLEDVLRGEWGFDGMVMTDWRGKTEIFREIKAGNDVYMPFGYPEKVDLALEKIRKGELEVEEVDACARRVIREVRRSHRFRAGDFGPLTKVQADGVTIIRASAASCVSSTSSSAEDDPVEGWCHADLGKDRRGNDTFLEFPIEVPCAGTYEVLFRARTMNAKAVVALEILGKETAPLGFSATGKWDSLGPVKVAIPSGYSILKVWFRNGMPFKSGGYKGVSFANMRLTSCN